MNARIRPVPRQTQAAWLFALGLFAVAMAALGGSGLMRNHAAGAGFLVEICSTRAAGIADLARQTGSPSLPDSGSRDCCQLCATSAPALLGDATLGVPPAPIFGAARFAGPASHPVSLQRLAHPPRGPPYA